MYHQCLFCLDTFLRPFDWPALLLRLFSFSCHFELEKLDIVIIWVWIQKRKTKKFKKTKQNKTNQPRKANL